MDVSQIIKEKRKEIGLTQPELAKKVGLSYMTIRRWETGKSSPNIEDIEKLSKVFNISVSELLGGTDTPEQIVTKHSGDDSLSKTTFQDRKYIGMSYWGNVVDNADTVAHSGDKREIRLIASLLERALASLNVQLAAVPA